MLDGNQKNRRDICSAKDAGYLTYPGLPGHIKTGCTLSPAFKSRFCSQHTTRACSSGDSTNNGSCVQVIIHLNTHTCFV